MPPVNVRDALGFNPRNNLALNEAGTRIFDGGLDGTSDVVEYTWPGQVFVANHDDHGGVAITIAVRGSTLWWIERNAGTSTYDLHEEGTGLVATIPDEAQGHPGVTYNASDDRFYVSNPVPSGGHELLRIHPTTGAVTAVLALTTAEAAPDTLPVSVTPDGAVWGLSWEASVSRPIWFRWDPVSSTGSYTTFPAGPYPNDEPYVLVPRPDNSVWFADQSGGDGYRLESDGTITAEPEFDPVGFDDFTNIRSVAQTADCSTVVFVSNDAWWLLGAPGGWTVGRVRWPSGVIACALSTGAGALTTTTGVTTEVPWSSGPAGSCMTGPEAGPAGTSCAYKLLTNGSYPLVASIEWDDTSAGEVNSGDREFTLATYDVATETLTVVDVQGPTPNPSGNTVQTISETLIITEPTWVVLVARQTSGSSIDVIDASLSITGP
jgi:hypothetical protein